MSIAHEAVIAAANKVDPGLYEILTRGQIEILTGLLESPDKLDYQLRTLSETNSP